MKAKVFFMAALALMSCLWVGHEGRLQQEKQQ